MVIRQRRGRPEERSLDPQGLTEPDEALGDCLTGGLSVLVCDLVVREPGEYLPDLRVIAHHLKLNHEPLDETAGTS